MAALPLLAQWIRSGPATVETGLAGALGLDGNGGSAERYSNLIARLKEQGAPSGGDTSFILGYLHQEAGKRCADTDQKRCYYEAALVHYEIFLQGRGRHNSDTRYFAQWQTGLIEQSLGHAWPLVEKGLLLALEYDASRAEALKAIITARYNQQEWRIAYIYSSHCVEQYLGRRPEGRYWGVDDDLYHWKLLRYHIPILLKLQKKEEAGAALGELKKRVGPFSASLSERDRETITYLIQKTEEPI
jgi:hypothetical protein